jgi:hypothetical protein
MLAVRHLALAALLILGLVSAHSHAQARDTKLELRIIAGDLERGLPKRFTFVFVNVSDHQLRMPSPTQCFGSSGTVLLRSILRPSRPGIPSGSAGGCGAGHPVASRGVVEWARSWKILDPGESLEVSYSRQALFNLQEDAGAYEFWGEYLPPELSDEDVSLLDAAGFDFPKVSLRSASLHFNRPQ